MVWLLGRAGLSQFGSSYSPISAAQGPHPNPMTISSFGCNDCPGPQGRVLLTHISGTIKFRIK
jgi:hypothetical protein